MGDIKIIENKDLNKLLFEFSLNFKKAVFEVLKEKDFVVLGFPGGRSIKPFLKEIKNLNLPWGKIHIFMIDERVGVLPDSDDYNFKQIKEGLLPYINIAKENVHPYEADANKYTEKIKSFGFFDILLLGVGEDSHIAALFPALSIREEGVKFFEFDNSPKAPPKRMTASKDLLLSASFAFMFFIGGAKKSAYLKFKNSSLPVSDCPSKIAFEIEKTFIITDIL